MTYQDKEIIARNRQGISNSDIATSLRIEESIVEITLAEQAIVMEKRRQNDKVLMVATASILTTLLDIPGPQPKSIIQMALQERYEEFQDLFVFNFLIGRLEAVGLLRVTSCTLALTPKGLELAKELDA